MLIKLLRDVFFFRSIKSENTQKENISESAKTIEESLDKAESLIQEGNIILAAQLLDQILVASPRNARAINLISKSPLPYSVEFYSTWLPGMIESSDHMLKHLFNYSSFNKVVDFGAGAGAWLTAAANHGAKSLVGIEGTWIKNFPSDLLNPNIEYRYGDLNDEKFLSTIDKDFDLAICVEVAEHIFPEKSTALVNAICSAAPTVVFGAALPRQWGNGHINCRSHKFWIDLFASQGFQCIDFFRPYFWFHPAVKHWYAQNTFLFVSDSSPKNLTNFIPPLLIDVYHPGTVNAFVLADHQNGIVEPK